MSVYATSAAASMGVRGGVGSCSGARAAAGRQQHLLAGSVCSPGGGRWIGGKGLRGLAGLEAGSRKALLRSPPGRSEKRMESTVAALAPMHRTGRESDSFSVGPETSVIPPNNGLPPLPTPLPSAQPAPIPPPPPAYEHPQDLLWRAQPHHLSPEALWKQVQHEAKLNSIQEPALASFLYSTILAHSSLEQAVAFILANKMASATLLNTQLMELFYDALIRGDGIAEATRADMHAVFDRDPACEQYAQCLLYFKGFQAVQAQRIAHWLWTSGRGPLAIALQSRVSEVFHVDIHPGAVIGKGILLDHATGVVIGETAVVGDNCSLLHHVTLGGSGTEEGDRHPKVGNGVLIGAGVSVLGNIVVGTGAKIGAGSVVLREVPEHSVAVGVPSRIVKQLKPSVEPALDMDQISGYSNEGFGI